MAYTVRTEPLGWSTKRRFNDFYWLRGVLQTQFPGYFVPPIPKKQNTGRLADETIIKRRRFLSRFMDTIIKTPIFLRSPFLVSFLSELTIDSVKKSASKLRKPEKMEDYNSIDGVSKCNESLAMEYMQQCNEYLSHNEILKKRLKKQSMALMDALKALSQQIEAVADTFRSLAEIRDTVTPSSTPSEIFTALSSALIDWSTYEMRIGEAVFEHFDTFYKYRYQEMSVLKDVVRDRDLHLAGYLKAEERLVARKEKLFAQGDTNKWELDGETHVDPKSLVGNKDLAMTYMLPRESAIVSKAKDLYAYYNYQTLAEVKRIVGEATASEKTNGLEFAQHHSAFLRDLQGNWGSLISTLSKIG